MTRNRQSQSAPRPTLCQLRVILLLLQVLPLVWGFSQSKTGSFQPRQLGATLQDGTVDTSRSRGTIQGPPLDSKPNYEKIHGPMGKTLDKVFMKLFRSKMAENVGIDSDLPQDDYQGLIELTLALNSRFSDRREVHRIAQAVLVSLFPSWMPPQYKILFSKPFPEFSSRMNAWATMMAGTWLMGECELNDVEVDGGVIGKDQGVLVKRCRFLEESSCASVCVNSCKIPTQNFFMENMGLPLTMTPNYETFECQFAFGLTPTDASEFDAKNTRCLSRCPSSGGMRKWHEGGTQNCSLMDGDGEDKSD